MEENSERANPSEGLDELRTRLQKLTNKQILHIVKILDVVFKDRSKASKAVLIQNLLEHVGPEAIPPAMVFQEIEKLQRAEDDQRPVLKGDLDRVGQEMRRELQNLGGLQALLAPERPASLIRP